MFKTVTRLSRSLSFRKKFLLIFLISVLPGLGLLTFNAFDDYQDILRDKRELQGEAQLHKISPFVSAISRHRSTSIKALSGGNFSASEYEAKAETAFNELKAVAVQDGIGVAKLTTLEQSWQTLRSSGKNTAAAIFSEHSALISQANEYRHYAAGKSGLLVDPDSQAFYLIATAVDQLPVLREDTSVIRATMAMMNPSGTGNDWMLALIENILNREIRQVVQRVDSDMDLLKDSQSATNKRLSDEWNALKQAVIIMQSSLSKQMDESDLTKNSDVTFKQMADILDQIDKVNDVVLDELSSTVTHRMAAENESLIRNLAVGLAVLSAVAFLIIGFARDISGRAEALESNMFKLASGDFTVVMEALGSDELSKLAASARQLSERLGNTLQEIRQNARELMQASGLIGDASSQVAKSTSEQSDAAASMAAAVEQLTVSISHMADNARDAFTISSESGRSSSEGGVVIQQTIEDIQSIAKTVSVASGSVSVLGQHAEEISGIVGVIKEIADQTNLLALNAAIEAARAGETGRGFAVVADEVRKLAERTTSSTQQIANTISRIQSGTTEAVTDMERGVEQVKHGVNLANQAGIAIAKIRESSQRVVNVVTEITDGLKEQSNVAQEVAGKVETIARMSENNSQAAHSTARTAEQLRTLALSLEQKVAAFKLN